MHDTAGNTVGRHQLRRHRRRATMLALLGAGLMAISSSFSPVAAATSAADLCDSGELDVEVAWDEGISDWIVTGLAMTELGATCEGVVVAVQVLGNATGDTSRPSSVVAEVFSDEDPCTGAEMDPRVGSVRAGELTLELCEQGPPVTALEVTGFRFFSGLPSQVLGETLTPDETDGTTGGGTSVLDGRLERDLPTAGSSPLAGGLLGVGAVLLGTGLLRLVRPTTQRREATR